MSPAYLACVTDGPGSWTVELPNVLGILCFMFAAFFVICCYETVFLYVSREFGKI